SAGGGEPGSAPGAGVAHWRWLARMHSLILLPTTADDSRSRGVLTGDDYDKGHHELDRTPWLYPALLQGADDLKSLFREERDQCRGRAHGRQGAGLSALPQVALPLDQ